MRKVVILSFLAIVVSGCAAWTQPGLDGAPSLMRQVGGAFIDGGLDAASGTNPAIALVQTLAAIGGIVGTALIGRKVARKRAEKKRCEQSIAKSDQAYIDKGKKQMEGDQGETK